MQLDFNIEAFIAKHITGRNESLFSKDLAKNKDRLEAMVKGKSVLVIGGAGTIGSSFIKAILQFLPGKLMVVDINENGLTELVRDCRSGGAQLPDDFKSYPIDFGDAVFEKAFNKEGPFEIVANFAAHKHVRSEKDIFSIEAMISNNVFKAKKLLDLLSLNPPRHFFCVSTDKAANPVNIMGASKKLMEELILAYSTKFKITTARFANVAFSNGSLLEGFMNRILKKQPLSCPSDVKRFFVSPKEAGEICLLACLLGQPGEILFPKLLEKDLINFSSIVKPFLNELGYEILETVSEEGARNGVDKISDGYYPVYFFSSNTSGEKLYEEFYVEGEKISMNEFFALGVIKNSATRTVEEVSLVVDSIKSVLEKEEKEVLVELLNNLLPGFNHLETGVHLDQKM